MIACITFDFDGTLVPTVSKPDDAWIDCELLELLDKLNNLELLQIAVVSGRSLDDLKMRIPIDGFTLVGSHGGEFLFSDGESCFETIPEHLDLKIAGLIERFTNEMKSWEGCMLERKPLGLALHYRNAPEQTKASVISAFSSMAMWLLEGCDMQVIRGDEVVEVRPKSFNKGTAVIKLLKKTSDKMLHPVYLGNDHTDEDAFRVLCDRGTTVLVGPKKSGTLAQFCVCSPIWTRSFLKQCLENWSVK